MIVIQIEKQEWIYTFRTAYFNKLWYNEHLMQVHTDETRMALVTLDNLIS